MPPNKLPFWTMYVVQNRFLSMGSLIFIKNLKINDMYANFSKDFILHTDASTKGLGAILYQKGDDDNMKVIEYASRTLRKAEMNYHPTKLEFLALKWNSTSPSTIALAK